MTNDTIIMKLNAVCQSLNNTTATGVQNMANIVGCYSVLQEVITALNGSDDSE